MPVLTTTQMNNLQAKLTANDTAGFYALLQSYGDPYGRLAAAVTNNNTWQGQLANAFAESAAGENADMDYNSTEWREVNAQLAARYLASYQTNNGSTPTWDQVQTAHNQVYDIHDIPRDGWLPNKLLNDSPNPAALWNDYLTNTGAADLWEDAAGIGFNVANLKYDPASGYITPQPDSSDGEFAQNFLKALSGMDKYAVRDMADDFTNNGTIFPILDFIAGLPANMSDFWDATPPLSPFLTGWGGIAGWLASTYGMLNGLGQVVTTHTPLVLDLNGDGAHSTKLGWASDANPSTTFFDMDNDGFAERTAWVSAGDGLLVMDKNSNGKIDGQAELFGNDATYANGFLNLKQYDSNSDNLMNASDTQWANLRVWVDADGDAVTDAGELKTLTELNITQINLNSTVLANTLDNENTVTDRSTFVMNGQTRNVDDIWFRVDQTSTHYMGDVTLNVATLFLPTLKGTGNLKDLHVAMSEDSTLLTMMQNFVSTTTTIDFKDTNVELDQKVQALLYRWAGVDTIDPQATTQGLNTQVITFLEKLTGYKTSYLTSIPANQNAADPSGAHNSMVAYAVQNIKAQLLVQIFGNQLFENTGYNLATGDLTNPPVLSSAGFAKIATDLSGLTSTEKIYYWNGLNTFLLTLKPVEDYSVAEQTGLNTLWNNAYGNTWAQYISGGSYYKPEWSFSGSNLSDYLIGPENSANTINGLGGDDYIQGGHLTNWLYGGAGNDRIISLSSIGDDIQGGDGDDFMNGGGGANSLQGGDGNDTYHIDVNAGVDIINDTDGIDTIEFGVGYNPAQFSFQISGTNMNLLFDAQLVATINGYFSYKGNIETIKFSDNTSFNLADYAFTQTGTSTAETLTGHNGTDLLQGLTGNDTFYGMGGSDTYLFNLGDGQDTVSDTSGTNDTILMGAGITSSNIRFENSSNSLIIYYSATDKVTLSNHFADDVSGLNQYDEVEYLKLADGTTYNLATWATFTGTTGADSITGTNRNDILIGLAGNDTITGGIGNDTINGGIGTDNLYGNAGDDTYAFIVGDGLDTVNEASGTVDTILMGAGITAANIRLEKTSSIGGDLIIYYGTSDKITIAYQFYTEGYPTGVGKEVEILKFSDGSTMSLINNLVFKGTTSNDSLYGSMLNDGLQGLAGNDVLQAGEGNDTLNGGTDNDSLYGGAGDDTYLFSIGDGMDTVSDNVGTNDTILMGAGITSSNIRFEKSAAVGGDLYIYYGTSDKIIIANHFYSENYTTNHSFEVEVLKFANLSTINLLGSLTFTGTSGSDYVYGTLMNDVLYGLGGTDYLYGGDGNDTLNGGAGNDYIYGQVGIDVVTYSDATAAVTVDLTLTTDQDTIGSGIDRVSGVENLVGSAYNDTLTGDANANTIEGGLGNDILNGGTGVDTVSYAATTSATTVNLSVTTAQNTISSGTDTLSGFENILGSGYNDTLTGDALANTIDGGNGNDTIQGGLGNDVLIGGSGVDTVSYAAATSAITFNLSVITSQDTLGAGLDSISGFENVLGSAYNDTLTGDALANTIDGGNGNDIIQGGLGNDVLIGGSGVDTISYAAATLATTVNLALTTAQNTSGAGTDTISGFENLTGSIYNDTLIGDALANIIDGGLGNDTLNGGMGNDTLNGNTGVDRASYAGIATAVTVSLAIITGQNTIGAGTDTLVGIEDLLGSSYNDTLSGNASANLLDGGDGNDTLNGGAGNDLLVGNNGIDTVSYAGTASAVTVSLAIAIGQNTVGAGTDTILSSENLIGSSYNDTLTGDGNANTIEGGLGNDTLNGGAGIDTVSYNSATAAVTVNLSLATAQNTVGAGTDTLSNFEAIFASAFNDTLTGSSAANTINGGGGNDLIVGGLGADILTGGLGADTFQFLSTGLDANFDRISDFGTAQADKIDVKNILVGFDAVTSAITNFIEFTTVGANTVVKVDRDGAGTTYGWQQVAQLDNVTGLTDEAALRASGNLIVA